MVFLTPVMRRLVLPAVLLLAACPTETPKPPLVARADVQPGRAEFRTQAARTTRSIDLWLTNTGNTTLTVQGVSVEGAKAASFSFVPPVTSSLIPQAAVRIVVRFTPPTIGEHLATLVIRGNFEGEFEVPLRGFAREANDCSDDAFEGLDCDDGDPCTLNDGCWSRQCQGIPIDCYTPPADVCDSPTTLQSFRSPGMCLAGACVYSSQRVPCSGGCVDSVCSVDLCAGVTCDSPPPCHEPGWCSEGVCQYPVVPGCGGAVAIATGFESTCAIGPDAGVWCWGIFSPALGDGHTHASSTPVRVLTSGPTVQLTTNCALEVGGIVECWGLNNRGEVGDGTFTPRPAPVRVSFDAGVVRLSKNFCAGEHRCAVLSGGQVQCWGNNEQGQLGDGTTVTRRVPTPVSGLPSDIVEVVTGDHHTCAVSATGGVWCWGEGLSGELGIGALVDAGVVTPTRVPVNGARTMALSLESSCAAVDGGLLRCWGLNTEGELGLGSTGNPWFLPVSAIAAGGAFVELASGGYFMCGVRVNGSVWCWGYNANDLMGQMPSTPGVESYPVRVPFDGGVRSISAGAGHLCGLRWDDRITCFGGNYWGALGNGGVLQTAQRGPVDVLEF